MELIYLRNINNKKDRKFVLDSLSGKNGSLPYVPDEENTDSVQQEENETAIYVFLHDLSLEMEEYIIKNAMSDKRGFN